MPIDLQPLKTKLRGDLLSDEVTRTLYATDASIYFEKPLAVAIPKDEDDIKHLIFFAEENTISLTFRTAGTSLAGQATGAGIIVDISKHFREILEINPAERWVRVQPGVVRDELNLFLKPHGFMFCPETSTSNRCMIGGMIGNNSCGEHSLIYGSTRDHLLKIRCLLSDGSEAEFEKISKDVFLEKCKGENLENKIYEHIRALLSQKDIATAIDENYPEPSIKRRNNGYALDILLHTDAFDSESNDQINLAKLICGSEGTLAFIAEAKLNIIPIVSQSELFICAHFSSLEEALLANLIALKYNPTAVELIDKTIIQGAANNLSQQHNLFFIEGAPEAILIIELAHKNLDTLQQSAEKLISELKKASCGYHFPVIFGSDMAKVRSLRKAGLGILTGFITDAKPHSFVEDTAVSPDRLPSYIAEFRLMLKEYGVDCAFYGHISTGELHFKPILNLRNPEGVELLKKIAYRTALLVKKYHGSLSGEHGDGRLRGEFLPLMLGDKVYNALKDLKEVFDPQYIFNRNKIIAAPCIENNLREQNICKNPHFDTYFDFSPTDGLLRAIERCNGSADCRKTSAIGGVMCPSYMATLDENNTTRARANLLREMLNDTTLKNPFAEKELYNILDLCLMCKGCKSECPSGIDMARYKTEFLQHHYDAHHIPLRTWFVGNITNLNRLGSLMPKVFNLFVSNHYLSAMLKKFLGFAHQRSLPKLSKTILRKWAATFLKNLQPHGKTIHFFSDEFTNYNDVEIGKQTIQLLTRLGYTIQIAPIHDSGRSYFSKGMVKKARQIANHNIALLSHIITNETPLVGIEPSAILSFRDEYPDIVSTDLKEKAAFIAKNSFTIEEFFASEFSKGNINRALFSKESKTIKLHGHCHQKALSSTLPTHQMLEIPTNYHVSEIASGCCGMAGSFGYEKEHYDVSMQIGELILFPEIRKSTSETIIVAPGTSCRQQIEHGTGTKAFHPVEVLFDALLPE